MELIYSICELQKRINRLKQEGKTIGFVPTMGALHAGHIALVKRCAAENDYCIVSIFVNPTQFNDKSDLEKYPRTLETDCRLLQPAGCSIVFAPEEKEMYPEPDTRQFHFGLLETVMEGAHRPGHFNGVAQIVSKLFDAVLPDKAYFGEKDFQQLAIIRDMVRQLNLKVEIIPCPIVREKDGLAMSSRNMRLNPEQRKAAVTISQTLFASKMKMPEVPIAELKEWIVSAIDENTLLQTEYVDIVDGNTLQPVSGWNASDYIVGCTAVFCGEVRLIDNIRYK